MLKFRYVCPNQKINVEMSIFISTCNICVHSLQKCMSKSMYGFRVILPRFNVFSTYILQLRCRHIFWRVILCKLADPYPEQDESEAVPIKNMAAQCIPNVDDFFDSLVRIIHGARSHLSTDDIDSAVF